jgi:single-strand DNA-binding protein
MPVMRYTPTGKAVCEFSIAANNKYKTADGTEKRDTVWLDIVCWNRTAEFVNRHCIRGTQVLVESRYTVKEWDQDGQKRSRPVFIASSVDIVKGGDWPEAGGDDA